MASFIEVSKKFKEFCDYYFRNPKGCQSCPLKNNCYIPPKNPEKAEEIVMNWQPNIYPTILELIRYIVKFLPEREDGKHWYEVPLNELVHNRIPEKIAKQFDIMPINACSLNTEEDTIESEWR